MRERRVGVAATMRGVARVMAGFGRLRVQIMILALLLTLRLILFDFHLLSKFGVLEPPPASQSHAESSFVEPHSFTESNSGTTDAAAMCTALLQPMQRVLCASRAHPELNLTDLLRNEIMFCKF